MVARRAHNPEVARSNRASATNEDLPRFIVRSVKTLKHSGWACHARQIRSHTLPYGVMASTEVSKTFSLGSNPSGVTIINIL